jgi:hypothetical protein
MYGQPLPTHYLRNSVSEAGRQRCTQPTIFRLRDGCAASIWMAPDESSLLTLDAWSVQTAPDGCRRIVWMINRMIKAHPTDNRMPRQAITRRTPDSGHRERLSAKGVRVTPAAGAAAALLGLLQPARPRDATPRRQAAVVGLSVRTWPVNPTRS